MFLDEDHIVRCRGRIHKSSLSYDSRHPVLLPKNHWLTQLVIKDARLTTLHGGVSDTLVHVRRKFWVPKARQTIKACVKRCVICRRYDARPLRYPGPPPLPKERVQEARPFQVVGVDYTGAIQLRNPGGGELESIKAYICLFT